MARQRIFDAAAGPATSAEIILDSNSAGAFCADIAVIFGVAGGSVSILVKDTEGVWQSYPNFTFTTSQYNSLELYGTNSIKISLDASVTNATVEV